MSVFAGGASEPHEGLVLTPFREHRGVYEFEKARALAKHLRTVAAIADRAQLVRVCPKAPDRPWVSVQEWTTNAGIREGQWQTDIEVVVLP